MGDFRFGWFTWQKYFIKLILKSQHPLGWKTDSGSWKWFTYYPLSLSAYPPYPFTPKPPSSSTSCLLTSIFSLGTTTICKDCPHMFQRGILQHVWLQGLWLRYMPGLSGLSNLCNSHCSVLYLYIDLAPGPQRSRISAFCLCTSSILRPLFFVIPSPLLTQVFLFLYILPETSALHLHVLRSSL